MAKHNAIGRQSRPSFFENKRVGFDSLLKHVAASGYDDWMGCEYAPLGKAEDTLGWMT
jgi:hydroxypyruvate isomerase